MSRFRRSMILSALGPGHALTILFLGTHTRTSQWVTHPMIALVLTRLTLEFRWNSKPVSSQKASCYMDVEYCSRLNSLNFEVLMEPEANELPKCLVLYGGGHVHIKHITPSPLIDVRCYNFFPVSHVQLSW
ncbi:unnamed protein product [Malus baccata var. baccata]